MSSSRACENATIADPSEGDTVVPTYTNGSTNGYDCISVLPALLAKSARKRRRLESLTTSPEIPEKTQRRDGPCDHDAERRIEQKGAEDRKDPPRCGRKQDQDVARTTRDDATRLRKTIQWLEEGGRRLREDLAGVRTELHEERRAAKIAKREFEAVLREARCAEAAKYQPIIAELKTRVAHSASPPLPLSPASRPASDLARDHESHKRELSTLRRRLAEAENTIQRLKWRSGGRSSSQANAARNATVPSPRGETRRLEAEVRGLRTENEKLEEKLRIALNAERTRVAELRAQRENHEAELSALRKSLRSETVRMTDELRGKSREIEKLSKLLNRKAAPMERDTMRKLRENERNRSIHAPSRVEKKILADDGRAVGSCVREVESGTAINEIEVERLRELALEQQEVIEILRQAVKEKERKLEQLSNKRRKEEFYRQWLELEPVAEVDDEEDRDENDSALSSAPSSMSPQPGGCGQWQGGNGVTREAYEAVLVEIEELQSKLLREQRELSRARIQACDLERTLSQQAKRHADRDRELSETSDRLRAAEEREAALLVELSEMREQNELLEFRLLELEETPARRESPDHAMDSGVVSPEPAHANKDRSNKQRSRAVATVMPYTNSNATTLTAKAASPVLPRKPPLVLQESGIFEEEEEEEEGEYDEDGDVVDGCGPEEEHGALHELASRGTQTQAPSGELLQEVQRLQELRARIQERAAKTPGFHLIDHPSSKICLDVTTTVDSIVQLTAYQERVRDLEERLEAREVNERTREREKRLSKQREEELLDENYRLTERIYWLENELRCAASADTGASSVASDAAAGPTAEAGISEDSGNFEDTEEEEEEEEREEARACPTVGTDSTTAKRPRRLRDVVSVEDQPTAPDARRNVTLVSLEEKKREDATAAREAVVEPVVLENCTESNSEKKVIYFRWR